jgi:copper(I)-binding protein
MFKPLSPLLLAAALLAPSVALSHSHKRKNLEVVHPYTMETTKGTTTAWVYMTIKNSGGVSERLVAASTPVAAKVELAVADGVTKDAAFTITPGKSLVLGPKGGYLVMTGVKKTFTAYGDFKMALEFEKSGRVIVDVMVEEKTE